MTAKKYADKGETPEFVIQGIQDDKNSDYFVENGSQTVTCNGCVITSEMSILELDTGGEYVEETVSFGAVEMV